MGLANSKALRYVHVENCPHGFMFIDENGITGNPRTDRHMCELHLFSQNMVGRLAFDVFNLDQKEQYYALMAYDGLDALDAAFYSDMWYERNGALSITNVKVYDVRTGLCIQTASFLHLLIYRNIVCNRTPKNHPAYQKTRCWYDPFSMDVINWLYAGCRIPLEDVVSFINSLTLK